MSMDRQEVSIHTRRGRVRVAMSLPAWAWLALLVVSAKNQLLEPIGLLVYAPGAVAAVLLLYLAPLVSFADMMQGISRPLFGKARNVCEIPPIVPRGSILVRALKLMGIVFLSLLLCGYLFCLGAEVFFNAPLSEWYRLACVALGLWSICHATGIPTAILLSSLQGREPSGTAGYPDNEGCT